MSASEQPFGLSSLGFKSKRLADIITSTDNAFIAEFGQINTQPQSVCGQIIGTISKAYADIWENLQFIYASQSPNSAFGVSLDNLVALNGIERFSESQTQVWASLRGAEGTLISVNALASIPLTNTIFFARNGGTISRTSADFAAISVDAVATQAYTVSLNSTSYTYSLPIITFTGGFVTGNITVVYINGIPTANVNFNTDTNTTVVDIAAAIAASAPTEILSATPAGATISIVPNIGFNAAVTLVTVTGGASQPTYAVTFAAPASVNQISQFLTAVINQGTNSWQATDLTGSLTILADNAEIPFNVAVGTNLTLSDFSTPILFFSQAFGAIPVPIGSLTNIVTPIGGWNSITNLNDGTLGRLTETDAELRLRRQNSIKLGGLATVETMRAHLLAIPTVTAASIFENVTMTETDVVITFSSAMVAGQTAEFIYNGGAGTITQAFTVDMPTTMAAIAAQFLLISTIDTAVVSGGDLVLTLTFNVAQSFSLFTANCQVLGTPPVPQIVVTGGQPPKSVLAIVQGGTDLQVANEIWRTKPAGIQTFGNTLQAITDSQGNAQQIFFSRPTEIYITAEVILTLFSEESFPTNGADLVAQAIFSYGQSLGVGFDVLIQRVQAQVFTIPGIASAAVQLAATLSPTSTPTLAAASIPIAITQISAWDIERITVGVV